MRRQHSRCVFLSSATSDVDLKRTAVDCDYPSNLHPACTPAMLSSQGYNRIRAFIAGEGFNAEGEKMLSHPDYQIIQGMWHPTLNLGKLPSDFTHRSRQKVWLECPGCIHECGRHHQWEAQVCSLTQIGGHRVCPSCESRGRGGRFCECQSVAGDPKLSREWHPSNLPANRVAKSSCTKYLWECPEGHPPYKATCNSRCSKNSGCPVCGDTKSRTTRHPVLSVGRPDLAGEWDHKRNTKSASEVTLGSHHVTWWVCSSNSEHPPWQAEVHHRTLQGTGCPACKTLNRFKPRKFGPAGG